MQSNYEIIPFSQKYCDTAAALVSEQYKQERKKSPLLPRHHIENPDRLRNAIRNFADNPGIAILNHGEMIAFMQTGYRFPFKGQNAVRIPEYCHAGVGHDRKKLYQQMYMYLAQQWAKEQIHLHIMTHFAHDAVLTQTLFELGFGAFLAERLRDLSDIDNVPDIKIEKETDPEKLVDLEIEHFSYYRNSPVFLPKDTSREYRLASLQSEIEEGSSLFVFRENDNPSGLMIVGESADGPGDEGFLLINTRTTQIKEAYISEHARGKGIGKALLRHAIGWAKENDYERLFVEHETANYYGGNFWSAHFTPYVYTSMRYIDTAI